MKRIVLAALTFGAMTTAAAAEPMRLDDSQMDGVTAGVLDDFRIAIAVPVTVVNAVALATAIGVLAENITADAVANPTGGNETIIDQGND